MTEPGMHPLFLFLMPRHAAEKDTPLGTFTRAYALVLPTTGSLDELRDALEQHLEAQGSDHGHIDWELAVLDVAWDLFQPRCSWVDCSALSVPDGTLCQGHAALRDLL